MTPSLVGAVAGIMREQVIQANFAWESQLMKIVLFLKTK